MPVGVVGYLHLTLENMELCHIIKKQETFGLRHYANGATKKPLMHFFTGIWAPDMPILRNLVYVY